MIATLVPAYGRHYKTIEAMQQAWDDGKDFQFYLYGTYGGMYCSKRDCETMFYQYGIDLIVLMDGKVRITINLDELFSGARE